METLEKKLSGYFEGQEIADGKPDMFKTLCVRKYGDSTILTEYATAQVRGIILRDITYKEGSITQVSTTFIPGLKVVEKEDAQTKKKHLSFSI
ncbi:MAG: hypothetical protein ABIH42_06700 [Planctomycetota bacterium]